MHDRCVVVGNAVVIGRCLVEIRCHVARDVFELDADMGVAVTSGLLVEPAQCVPNLVHSRKELATKQIEKFVEKKIEKK